MSCGQGFEIWKRECNNPEPKYGGRNCGHLGEAVEYRQCFERNCPVNGGYGNWTLSIPCSVSCGVGIEIWRRSCDNPEPKYGGRNCSELGNSIEFRKCKRITCPIDGNYGNWTRSSSCSTTCGKGVETWARRCDNPPGKYGGNCSKHGPAEELRICVMAPCPGSEITVVTERVCIPAEAEPVFTNSHCRRLIKLKHPFCQHYGFKLDENVFSPLIFQQVWNDDLWYYQERYETIPIGDRKPSPAIKAKCTDLARFLGCYHLFQGCDKTGSVFRPKKVCKETCLDFLKNCGTFVKVWEDVYLSRNPRYKSLFSCSLQPLRSAGDSPECMFYAEKESLESEDCLYFDGSSYHGNVSVTASGIPCQFWTEQCPHRHTMSTTYPELDLAKNYCRNPQNSGQRPWCFTTDRNKRWEYCDIPKCKSVDGRYGNWSLNSSCSVTCGKGIEIWRRECENPKPRYGGRNCSHLGNATEYRPCTGMPCPAVSSGNSSWYIIEPCNVSCGQGVETWRRSCDNSTSKNGGQNCSVLGEEIKYKICNGRPCVVENNIWHISSACTVTCGDGYEVWHRKCDNSSWRYGQNCSKYGVVKETRACHMKPCPTTRSNFQVMRTIFAVCVSIITVGIGLVLIGKRKVLVKWWKRRNDRSLITPYAIYEPRDHPSTNDPIYESIGDGLNSRVERIYESIDENVDETISLEETRLMDE